jgi:GNAT superfamily N-acetyltransferase
MAGTIIEGLFDADVDVVPVQSLKHLKDFVFLPWKIYKPYPHWIPSLISKEFRRLSRRKNPFFEHSEARLFVAYQNARPVGRIAAINNTRHEALYHDQTGFFGFFECVPNYFIAKRLLMEAEKWCQGVGKKWLQGPVNLTIHDEYGLLVAGFNHKPYIFMPYHPPYYQAYLTRHGFQKSKDLYIYSLSSIGEHPSLHQLERVLEAHPSHPPLTFDKIDKYHWSQALRRMVTEIFNHEWQQQYGYTPLSDKELEFRLNEYAKWIIPELILIGKSNHELVGCMIVLPNFNEVIHRFNGILSPLNHLLFPYFKGRIKTTKCILLMIRKAYRFHNYPLQFMQEAMRRTAALGFQSLELGWVAEDQKATRHMIERFGLKPTKTYRIYAKEITHGRRIPQPAPQQHIHL